MKIVTHSIGIFISQLLVLYFTNNFWIFVGMALLTGLLVTKKLNFFYFFVLELVAIICIFFMSSHDYAMMQKFSEISTLSPILYTSLVVVITCVLFAAAAGMVISYRNARIEED